HGIADGAIHMGFSRQVDNAIGLLSAYQFMDKVGIRHIAFYKSVIRLMLNIHQVRQIASIGEVVQVENLVIRICIDKASYDMVTNKPRPTCNNDLHTTIICFNYIKLPAPNLSI